MIEKLKKNYKLIIVDCEAGLEHISRKTLGNIDIAFIISDLSRKGILTAKRQVDLFKELDLKTESNFLIINNIIDESKIKDFNDLIKENCKENLIYAGFIHNDEKILEFERIGKSALTLENNTVAFKDLSNIVDNIKIKL